MPIDPEIPLHIQAPKPLDFSRWRTPAQRQREEQQSAREELQLAQERIATQKAQQAQADEDSIRSALTRSGGDPEAARQILNQTNPRAALALQDKITASQEADLKRKEAGLKLAEAQHGYIANGLNGVEDEPSYQQFRKSVGTLVNPSMLPERYDPAWKAQQQKAALTVQQQLEEARRKLEDERKDAAEKRAQAEEQRSAAKEGREAKTYTATHDETGKPIPTPTGTLAEFKTSFLPGWLQSHGLPQNAVNESKAYAEWKAQAATPTADQREFKQYQQEGGKLNFFDWQRAQANLKNPIPKSALMMVPNGQGGYDAKMIAAGQNVPGGTVTPSGMSSMNVPTSTTRTMAETAPKVTSLAARVRSQIAVQRAKLGPLASRWSEFMAGTVGAPNADFTRLRTDVGLLQTALMRMHVGARGGEGMMEHFKDLLNAAKQSPDNLTAALDEIEAYANSVAHASPGPSEQPPAKGKNIKEMSTDELFQQLLGK